MDTELHDSFRELVAEFLIAHPDLPHQWTDEPAESKLAFSKESPDGFDVAISLGDSGLFVTTDHGWHWNRDEVSSAELRVRLSMVRDLLSENTRLVEKCASGRPYMWKMEFLADGEWQLLEGTALFRWNYLGRRSTCVFRNRILPSRELGAPGW